MIMKTEILYGIHPVTEALKAGRREFLEVYICKSGQSKRFEKVLASLELAKIPIKKTSPYHLNEITQTDMHQGIAAKASPYPFATMMDILESPDRKAHKYFLLLLDLVVDPRNLGALVRTAICVGADGIIIPKNRSALPSPLVSKASSGALEHALIAKVTNSVNTILALKEKGIWVIGLEKKADRSIFASDLRLPLALVIGGEEKGIRPLVKKKCDYLVSIPQSVKVNSLNASVAGGVMMYEIFRQRQTSGQG